jgi:hypothetical protein
MTACLSGRKLQLTSQSAPRHQFVFERTWLPPWLIHRFSQEHGWEFDGSQAFDLGASHRSPATRKLRFCVIKACDDLDHFAPTNDHEAITSNIYADLGGHTSDSKGPQ